MWSHQKKGKRKKFIVFLDFKPLLKKMNDLRSASSKRALRDVDVDGASNRSSLSDEGPDDIQVVLSSSSKRRPEDVNSDLDGPLDFPKEHVEKEPVTQQPLPALVFAWHFMTRATCCVFTMLNDITHTEDTRFVVFFLATTFALLNMLLLSILKPRKRNHVLCAFGVFSSVESCILVFLPDFLLYTLPSLLGAWLLLFFLSLNPCAMISARCKQKTTLDNGFAYRRPTRKCWLTRNDYLYARMLWFLLLSIVSETSNVLYFWFLMQTFDQESDIRKQRIVLCCIQLKLLFTTYTRHMLFERRFSFMAMCSEFLLFATTCTVVYLNTFLQLTQDQYLVFRYTFWTALGLEILVNFIMFVRFSAHAIY